MGLPPEDAHADFGVGGVQGPQLHGAAVGPGMEDQVAPGGHGREAGPADGNRQQPPLGGEVIDHGLGRRPGQEALVPQAGLEAQDRTRQAGELVEGLQLELLAQPRPLVGHQTAPAAPHQDAGLPQGIAQGRDGLTEDCRGDNRTGVRLQDQEAPLPGAHGQGGAIGAPDRGGGFQGRFKGNGLPGGRRFARQVRFQPPQAGTELGGDQQLGGRAQAAALLEPEGKDPSGGGVREEAALPLGTKLPVRGVVLSRGLGPGEAGQEQAAVRTGHQGLAPGVRRGDIPPGEGWSSAGRGQGATFRQAHRLQARLAGERDRGLPGLIQPDTTGRSALEGAGLADSGRQEEGGCFFEDEEQHGEHGADNQETPAGDGEGHEAIHALGAGLDTWIAGHGSSIRESGGGDGDPEPSA